MHQAPEEQLPQDKDKHLDIPSEANQDKHINFRELEDDGSGGAGNGRRDEVDEARQQQWREGIEAGKRARNGEE